MFRLLVVGILALALPLTALANAVVESVRGDVQVAGKPLKAGQRIIVAATVTTGPGSQVFLRFDDGMQIVLTENSLLRMIDFRFTPTGGSTDRAVFELLRGGARVVTGKIAASNPTQFFFRTPQTQLTVERPADFTVALVNPAYITVNVGSVLSSNGYGAVPLNAGTTSVVASNAAPVAGISASQLPASAASAMSNLSLASVSAPAGGAAAGVGVAAAGTAGAGLALPLVAIGAAIAGVAAAANSGDDAPAAVTPTTHH